MQHIRAALEVRAWVMDSRTLAALELVELMEVWEVSARSVDIRTCVINSCQSPTSTKERLNTRARPEAEVI